HRQPRFERCPERRGPEAGQKICFEIFFYTFNHAEHGKQLTSNRGVSRGKERERGANAPRWIDRHSNLTLPSRFPSTIGPESVLSSRTRNFPIFAPVNQAKTAFS